jgi:hypothetical protein
MRFDKIKEPLQANKKVWLAGDNLQISGFEADLGSSAHEKTAAN